MKSGSEWYNVLGGVHWVAWPADEQRADRVDWNTFALFTSSPRENQCPEDQPRKGSRLAEPGGHCKSPAQHPGPAAPRGKGRRAQLPALQSRSAHMVWPVWRLHLGTLQAEPAVCQWVGLCILLHLGVCMKGFVHMHDQNVATQRERGNWKKKLSKK